MCDDVSVKDKNNRYYHLNSCKDDTGRLNLNKLISMSEHPDRKYKPRVDFAMLQELGGGMIFMSACLAGEVSRALLDGDDVTRPKMLLCGTRRSLARTTIWRFKAIATPIKGKSTLTLSELLMKLGFHW